jgi:hypothetical protein
VAELEDRLQLNEKMREDKLFETGQQLAELGDREAALGLATANGAGRKTRLAAMASEHNARETASSFREETLTSAYSAIDGSLRTARVEPEALSRENESLQNRLAGVGDPAADSQLRESISRLGQEVVRLFSAQKPSDGKDPRVAGRDTSGVREVEYAPVSNDGTARRFGEGRFRRALRSRATER